MCSFQPSPGLGVVSRPNLTAGNTLTCLVSPKLIYRQGKYTESQLDWGSWAIPQQTPIQLPKVGMRPDSPSAMKTWRLLSTLGSSSRSCRARTICVVKFRFSNSCSYPEASASRREAWREGYCCSLCRKGQSPFPDLKPASIENKNICEFGYKAWILVFWDLEHRKFFRY